MAIVHVLRGRLLERRGDGDRARGEWRAAIDRLEPIVWGEFQTQRVRTYTQAKRLLGGEEAVRPLFDRFRELGYAPVATER
jgi:hypothetical protein